MNLSDYSCSQTFFEASCEMTEAPYACVDPFKGRVFCFASLVESLAVVPFFLFCKGCKTVFRVMGLGLGAALVFLSLGGSSGVRGFFFRRAVALAQDLADWVLYPFSLVVFVGKLLFSILFSPAFYLHI